MPTFGSLFSGVGGFDLGLERAGWECRWQVEKEPYRRSILAHHWPNAPRFEDVTTVDPAQLESVDLICGGFPCQDLSVAGRRAGLIGGTRSSLFFEIARIADAVRPRWLLIENVPGLFSSCSCLGCGGCRSVLREHRIRCAGGVAGKGARHSSCGCSRCEMANAILSAHRGTDFAVVLSTLAKLGYRVAWRILDSRYFGVPQRRRRIFVVGHLGARSAEPFLPFLEGLQGHLEPRETARANVASSLGGGSGSRGWCDDFDRGGASSLSGLGSGGADDNDAQAGRLVAIPLDLRNAARASGMGAGTQGDGVGSEGDPSFTLSSTPFDRAQITSDKNYSSPKPGDPAAPLAKTDPHIAFALRKDPGGTGQGHNTNYVPNDTAVRRFTPTECARLQGFPDDWLGTPNEQPDGPRYAAMGDAVTVNVAEWIGKRLLEASA